MFCNVYFVDLEGNRELYLERQRMDLYTVRDWYALYSSLLSRQQSKFTKLLIVPQLPGIF